MPKRKTAAPKPERVVVDFKPRWQRQEATYVIGRAAIDSVDVIAIDCERYWGVGRLRLLVDEELRSRFDSQRLKLRHAIAAGELEEVRREAARMANAWRALDAAAKSLCCAPLVPEVWEVGLPNGRVLAVVKNPTDARHVLSDGRGLDVITLDEVANLVHGFPELAKIRDVFPGAEVTRVRPIRDPLEVWEDEGDEIPFGGDAA